MNDADALISAMGKDARVRELAMSFLQETAKYRYTYHFSWMGRPIVQAPQDVMAMQELIWQIKPQCIIETGVAHGGSVVFYASMLELLGGDGVVVGVDVEIKPDNRRAIEAHPMGGRIHLVEGSSTDLAVLKRVREIVGNRGPVLVALDSNHTHDHVLRELELYSTFVRAGSYVVVFDTTIEDMPDELYPNRPWNKLNNPKTAVRQFLRDNSRFVVDQRVQNRLQITVAMDGYLKCVAD